MMPFIFIGVVAFQSTLTKNLLRSAFAVKPPFMSVMLAGLAGSIAALPVHFQVPPPILSSASSSAGGFGASIFLGSSFFGASFFASGFLSSAAAGAPAKASSAAIAIRFFMVSPARHSRPRPDRRQDPY